MQGTDRWKDRSEIIENQPPMVLDASLLALFVDETLAHIVLDSQCARDRQLQKYT